jgi:hypothetical protein
MSDQRQQALAEQAGRIKQSAERKIWVTFRKEGIHCYPAAATDPKLNTAGEYDVSFLANPHRHIFHFRVWIDVFHNDRDIEFIQFKRWLENLYSNNGIVSNPVLELDWKSCEMVADDLYDQIAQRYPNRAVSIEVAEDGENGCLINYNLTRPNLSVVI